jgi:hypothetical protein
MAGVLPANVSFFMQRLQGLSVSHFKINPQSNDTATANKILRFELPSNSLLNLASLRMVFNASAGKTAAAGGRLPNGVYKLIERVAIYAGGTLIQNNFQSYNLYQTAKEALTGSKCDSVLGHPEIVRTTSYHDGSPITGTNNESYTDTDDQFAITNWEGLLGSLAPTIIDTGILPQLTIEITLAEDSVCSSCAGTLLDGTGTNHITDAHPTNKATYELTNISMQVEVMGLATSVLDQITEQRIASTGYISCPFTNVFTYVSSHQGSSRFSVNSASWDRVWLVYRETGFSDKAGVHRVPGYKKQGAFVSTAAGSYAGGFDVGVPDYDHGGSLDTNKEKYISKYFRMKEPLISASVPATYQLQINGATVPAFKCNRSEMYAITRNSVDSYHTEHSMTMNQYVDSYFVQCFRFCLPDSSMSRLASGLDTRSVSAQAAVETSGLALCNLTVFAECTSELRIGSGRAVSVVT